MFIFSSMFYLFCRSSNTTTLRYCTYSVVIRVFNECFSNTFKVWKQSCTNYTF